MNANGTYTYTPDANFYGTDQFTYRLCDVDGDCSVATVSLTITSVNDLPVAVNDAASTPEDVRLRGSVAGNDTPSGDGGNLWSLVGVNGGAAHGTVAMGADGTYTYTPDANYNGTDTFVYRLCDANGDCSTASVTITVNSVGDAPHAVDDQNVTPEDTPVSGNASLNDTPSGDGGNVWSLVGINGGATRGTVTMTTSGVYTYTPKANSNGTDVFVYQIYDADGDGVIATVTLTVVPVNDLPLTEDDVVSTPEDTPLNGSVAGNDSPSGDGGNAWSLVGISGGATHGTVVMSTDGTYTYTPEANFNGTDEFTYHLCDVDGDCSVGSVTITVSPVNDLPVAVNDAAGTPEDTQLRGSVAGNDSPSGDAGNGWSLAGINGGAAHGTVTMNTNGTYTYTPSANFNGTDEFTYHLCDVNADCAAATVSVTVHSENDAPEAVNDENSTPEDTPVSGDVSTNDTPSGDGGNGWSLVGTNGGALHGTLAMNSAGSYTYTPRANYNGSDEFTYQLCDANGDCSVASVALTIIGVNDVPIAVNDTLSMPEDTHLKGSVAGNDTPSGDGGNGWTLVGTYGGALHGTLTMGTTGRFVYIPAANYNGTDSFTYKLCDTDNDCSTATVIINIDPVDDAPAASNDVNLTSEDTPASGNVSTNDTPSGDGGNGWALAGTNGGALHGTIVMNTDGTYTYTPRANYNGTDVFVYQLCDADGDCAAAMVTMTIISVNDVPVAVNDAAGTTKNIALNESVAGNDTPSGDGDNTWMLTGDNGGAAHGTVTMTISGTYTYTPNSGYIGSDVFLYHLCDVDNNCSTALVTITVNPVGDVPVAFDDAVTTAEDNPVSGTVAANDTPSADGGNRWSLVGTSGGALHGAVTMNTDGTYTYTPEADYNGTDRFTYELCDADDDCVVATVSVTITSVNDLPQATDDAASTPEDIVLKGSVAANDTPSGDGGNVWSLVGTNGGAAHGTLTMTTSGIYTYTPNANFHGTDRFTYRLCDAGSDCSPAEVTLTIDTVDDAPVAVNDANTCQEDAYLSATVAANDTPSGDGGNRWSLVGTSGGSANGTVVMNPDGTYTYTPEANYHGVDVFTYEVCDADEDCSVATVTIEVVSVNDLPHAANDSTKTSENTPVYGTVVGNDSPSGDGGNTWSLIGTNGGAEHGTVTLGTAGSNSGAYVLHLVSSVFGISSSQSGFGSYYVYTPNAEYAGTDAFTYEVCDGDGDCATARVYITIDPVVRPPLAVADVQAVTEDIPVSGRVSSNDTPGDAGGNVWSLTGENGGALNGTLTMNPNGTYTYVPAANYNGTDQFTYQLCDAGGFCSSATVTLNIAPVNDLPVAVNDVAVTSENLPVRGNVESNDTPSGDGGNSWSLAGTNGGAAHGTVTMTTSGTYVYTPASGFGGTDVFTYHLCDGSLPVDCATATVTITVNIQPLLVINNPGAVCSPATVNLTATSVTQGSKGGYAFTYWSDATATTAYPTPTAATSGTWYIKGLVPGTGTYDIKPVTVTVHPVSVGGRISGSSAITYGSPTGTLSLGGQTGTVVKWQKRMGSGLWTDIVNTATSYNEAPSTAGTWIYRAQVRSGVCSEAFSGELSVIVAPKELTVTGAVAQSKVYDGTRAARITGATLVGRIGSDAVTLADMSEGTFSQANAGTDIVVTTSPMILTGSATGNYTLTQPTGLKANITPKPVTVTAAAANKVYDGTTSAAGTPTFSPALVAGNTPSFTQAFDTKMAGTGKPVVPAGKVSDGNDGNNYAVTFVNATGAITPLSITGRIAVADKVFDGTTDAVIFTRSLTGAIPRDEVGYSGGTARFDSPSVGAGKTVMVTDLSLMGDDAPNYTVNTSAQTTAAITPFVAGSALTISSSVLQYSDQVVLTAVLTGGARLGSRLPAAQSVTFTLGGQVMNDGSGNVLIPLVPSGDDLVATLTTTLTETLAGSMAPGVKTVSAAFLGSTTNFALLQNPAATDLTINREDAEAAYSGDYLVPLTAGGTASVMLSATVRDLSADPGGDRSAGDIRKTTVTFMNRSTNTPIATVPVALVSLSDTKTGIARFNWTGVTKGDYLIEVIVNNYYAAAANPGYTVVDVRETDGNYLAGGGYGAVITNQMDGQPDFEINKQINFGFDVRFDDKGTVTSGRASFILFRDTDGVRKRYWFHSDKITAVAANIDKPSALTGGFTGPAILTDITDPLSPVDLENDLVLVINMTDRNGTGSQDGLLMKVWQGTTLYYSTDKEFEMSLTEGDLIVHSSVNVDNGTITGTGTYVFDPGASITAYPNPSRGIVNFKIAVDEGSMATLDLLAMNGTVISRVFEGYIGASTGSIIHYDSRLPQGIYLYRLKTSTHILYGKIVIAISY